MADSIKDLPVMQDIDRLMRHVASNCFVPPVPELLHYVPGPNGQRGHVARGQTLAMIKDRSKGKKVGLCRLEICGRVAMSEFIF